MGKKEEEKEKEKEKGNETKKEKKKEKRKRGRRDLHKVFKSDSWMIPSRTKLCLKVTTLASNRASH